MVQNAFTALQWLVTEYKRLAIIALFILFCFPFVTTAILWMDRTGYFPNVYQQEHRLLRDLAEKQQLTIDRTLQVHEKMSKDLIINRSLISDGTYYQQRTCANTAASKEDRNKCFPAHKEFH